MATLKTSSGEKVTIRATTQSGEVAMDGTTYQISDVLPASGRRLDDDLDGLKVRDTRRLGFGGALMTAGSFTMMSSGSAD